MGPSDRYPLDETFSEAQQRAGVYSLLSNLLFAPPGADMLRYLSAIEDSPPPGREGMGSAWLALRGAARESHVAAVDDEYHAIFLGLGRGEVVPYGSWYLTGFLMEKPLGDLRRDLARLGYERCQAIREPEDHAAALCEVMALLITDSGVSFAVQKAFYETHVGSWVGKFFVDLEGAQNARFYRAVGRLGREFMGVEQQYLSMLA